MKITYPSANSVSIWVGSFFSEEEFDLACDGHLEPKLCLPTSLAAICEVSFEGRDTNIEVLLHGFSGCDSFIEQAKEVANAKGLSVANAALVCYHLSCEGSDSSIGGLRFLGTFNGTDTK
jgi:hypothetical protein